MGTAFQIYLADTDDRFPKSFGVDGASGAERFSFYHRVPQNWDNTAPYNTAQRQDEDGQFWANSIQPYVKSYELYDDSGFPKTVNAADNADFAIPANAAKARNTLFTYNGILHNVSSTEIASPSKLPLFWLGFGKSPYAGRGLSNPSLVCPTAATPCRFNPTGPPNPGGGAAWYWATGASGYVFGQGMNYSFSDSSAKFRNIGRVAPYPDPNPNRDYNNSPFAHIEVGGRPSTMWFCTITGATVSYPCLFRPDQEFNL